MTALFMARFNYSACDASGNHLTHVPFFNLNSAVPKKPESDIYLELNTT